MVNGKKDCNSANFLHYKSSDIKKLSADAKILIALTKQQPQKRLDLIKSAGIHPTTFSRIKRLLLNGGIIKETAHGYCLWNYIEPTSLWNRLRIKLQGAGGPLIDLKIEKLELGDKRDPITGWYETIFDKLLPVQGIIILKGAKELEAAASLHVPNEFLGFLLTQGSIVEGDRFLWHGKRYVIQEVEEVIDGCELGYRIAKLVVRFHQPQV